MTDTATLDAERDRIRDTHLKPTGERPASIARGAWIGIGGVVPADSEIEMTLPRPSPES